MEDADFWMKQPTIDVLVAAYLLAGEPLPQELSHSVNDAGYPPRVVAMIRLIKERAGAVVRVSAVKSRRLLLSKQDGVLSPTIISQVEFQRLLKEQGSGKSTMNEPAASEPTQEKPLTAKERNSLLRIIRALDVMAKLPDRGPASSVQKQLQELGFSSPSDDTIRKVISEARKLEGD